MIDDPKDYLQNFTAKLYKRMPYKKIKGKFNIELLLAHHGSKKLVQPKCSADIENE